MAKIRVQPSSIKNKVKREEIFRKNKRAVKREKLEKRLARAKIEAVNPEAKRKRLEQNVPHTLDNQREFDHQQPSSSTSEQQNEIQTDLDHDPFGSYFSSPSEPHLPPKILITTSAKATKVTYDFCDELVGVFPGADFIPRKRGKGFEMGRIAGWAAERGYKHMCVVNEDMRKPNAMTLIYLPDGPTAYFKLTSIELTKQIFGHARATAHYPELILNNFVTRLGHSVGRMLQTLFPPVPEFQGRQVVTFHNQRDFLFFRRHRYAFRSTEKVALQEIGPRFTLKLRSLRKGIPAVRSVCEGSKPLSLAMQPDLEGNGPSENSQDQSAEVKSSHGKISAPKEDEFMWKWKPELETSRRMFFL